MGPNLVEPGSRGFSHCVNYCLLNKISHDMFAGKVSWDFKEKSPWDLGKALSFS